MERLIGPDLCFRKTNCLDEYKEDESRGRNDSDTPDQQ